jgi:hypothetical protein
MGAAPHTRAPPASENSSTPAKQTTGSDWNENGGTGSEMVKQSVRDRSRSGRSPCAPEPAANHRPAAAPRRPPRLVDAPQAGGRDGARGGRTGSSGDSKRRPPRRSAVGIGGWVLGWIGRPASCSGVCHLGRWRFLRTSFTAHRSAAARWPRAPMITNSLMASSIDICVIGRVCTTI